MRDRTTTSSSFRPKRESARFESTDCLMRWPGASWRIRAATQCTRLIGLERWSLKWLRVNSKTGTIEPIDADGGAVFADSTRGRRSGARRSARRDRERPRLRRFKGSRKGHPGQNGPVAIWLLAPSPKSVAGSRFFVLYRKTAWKSATQERAAFWAAITSIENAS